MRLDDWAQREHEAIDQQRDAIAERAMAIGKELGVKTSDPAKIEQLHNIAALVHGLDLAKAGDRMKTE